MGTNSDSEFFFLLIGLALAAIGGPVAAFLARNEIWDLLSDRSMKTRHSPIQQGEKLR